MSCLRNFYSRVVSAAIVQYENEIPSCKRRGNIFQGVTHLTIHMYGYTFNLPIFVCDWERSIVYLGWMLDKKLVSLHVHGQAAFGSTLINTMNQNNCLGAIASYMSSSSSSEN